jgi:hypothetical protein
MKSNFDLLISLVIYLISLFLPSLYGGGTYLGGLVLLCMGWAQIPDGQCFAWISNPIFASAVVCFLCKNFKPAGVFSLAASVVGLDTFRATVFSPDARGMDVQIEAVGSAFYLWQLSFIVLAVASFYRVRANNSFKPDPD